MAALTPFSFRPGKTLLHGFDVRFKLILVVVISLSMVTAAIPALSAVTALFILLSFHIRMSITAAVKELRYFFFLLILVFFARLFSTPGEALFKVYFITVTKDGMVEGALVCWRLLLVVYLGILFISTTRISRIKWAVEWFLSPIPFIPGKRIATMMGLIVRFIPVIFHKTREVSEAQRARCSENIKNPFIRLKRLAFPMVRSVFQDAENVAMAMASRCYSEEPRKFTGSFRRIDWLILGLGMAFSATVFIL
jgi:biotin transport system permease protein